MGTRRILRTPAPPPEFPEVADGSNWVEQADIFAALTMRSDVFGVSDTSSIHSIVPGANAMGPNWLAASNAPTSLKDAVSDAGGIVCDGTADNADFDTQLAAFGHVQFTEGTYNLSGTIAVPGRRYLQGPGSKGELVGASGLSGAFITTSSEHTWLKDFTMSAGGEAASTNHIDSNVTSSTGFTTGADACTQIEGIISRNAKGDGIIIQGFNNRDSKIRGCHVWNAVGRGYYINSPDGNLTQCISGTSGSHGIELGTSAGNWHVDNSKFWYADGDGMRIAGVRHTLDHVEAQDCDKAGIRILGNYLSISNWLADSNSYVGSTAEQNWHSGLEVGLNTATAAGTPGSASGGFHITIGTGMSWDKNEGSRGRMQRYGVLLRSGIRDLNMYGVSTGDPADSHFNATGGINFLTSGDKDDATNSVYACLNHKARMASV